MPSTQPIPHLHAIVLAGGSGTRFWPLSRELSPKQFVSIFGGVSLITQAVERVAALVEPDGVHVLTNERLLDELRNHLKAQESLTEVRIDYLAEPVPRNTAPAIALAAAYLLKEDPDALMIVLPSDHLIDDGEVWDRTIRLAADIAEAGHLATIGLEPTRPETGYGYIRKGDPLSGFERSGVTGYAVDRFVEKPDPKTAERFLAEGAYLWNSGMLVARAAVILEELAAAGDRATTNESADSRTIAETARTVADAAPADWTDELNRSRFADLPAVPFDKAALEVSDVVAVVPTDMPWSDVGSLLALEALADTDEHGNVLVGHVTDVDSTDCIIYSQDRLMATLGLDDLVVVDTADATLVARKDRAQDVRLIVDALKAVGAPEVVETRSSLRPWGSWTLLLETDGFKVKTIDVLPGSRLSLQSHQHRSEHWIVVEGTATVTLDDATFVVSPGESTYIPLGTLHRLENASDGPLRIVEVAVGDYLGEDDITRYQDDWAR